MDRAGGVRGKGPGPLYGTGGEISITAGGAFSTRGGGIGDLERMSAGDWERGGGGGDLGRVSRTGESLRRFVVVSLFETRGGDGGGGDGDEIEGGGRIDGGGSNAEYGSGVGSNPGLYACVIPRDGSSERNTGSGVNNSRIARRAVYADSSSTSDSYSGSGGRSRTACLGITFGCR